MQLSKVILCAIFLALLNPPSVTLGDGPALSLHVNQDGRFEAMMPRGTKDSIIEGEQLTDTKYVSIATVDGVSYRVRVQVISPIKLDEQLTDDFAKSFFAQARDQHGKASDNKLQTDREFKQHGFPCSEFAYDSPVGNGIATRHRVLFDGLRLYLASITGPSRLMETTAAKEFLDSVGPKGSNAKATSEPTRPNVPVKKKRTPAGLRPYVNAGMGIEALMPKKVQEVNNPDKLLVLGQRGDTSFLVSTARLDNAERERLSKLTPAQRVDELRPAIKNLIADGVPDKITRRDKTGWEVVGSMKGVPHKARARVFASDATVYIIATWGADDFAMSNDATDFLDSLRIGEPGELRAVSVSPERKASVGTVAPKFASKAPRAKKPLTEAEEEMQKAKAAQKAAQDALKKVEAARQARLREELGGKAD